MSATSPHTQAIACRSSFGQPRCLQSPGQPVDHAPLMAWPHMATVSVGADAVLLFGSPLTVVGQDVGHHFTSGGPGSGIQCVTSAHHSQLPLMYSLSNTSVPSVAKTRTSSSGSRSLTGIHSPIASSRCVTQKQTQNVSFLMHFRYQKNRPCRKVAFAVCELRPECHVFSQKNLPYEGKGTSGNDQSTEEFPAAAAVPRRRRTGSMQSR
jgi:hypothetical protein